MNLGTLVLKEQWRGEIPATYQWGEDDTSAAIVYDVTHSSGDFFAPVTVSAGILGYATYVQAARSISRTLSMNLYDARWLYASKITSMKGRGAAFVPTIPAGGATAGYRTIPSARYKTYRCTVLFTARDYDVLPDGAVTAEYQRFVRKEYHPGIENIQRRQGQMFFANGSLGPDGVHAGQAFPMGIIRRSPKSSVVWTWHGVPARAVLLPNGVLGPNITQALGCINHAEFPPAVYIGDPAYYGQFVVQFATNILAGFVGLGGQPIANQISRIGYSANTLLLTQVGVKNTIAPVFNQLLGGLDESQCPRTVDLTFCFSHFDPPIDPNVNYGGYAGHLLVPACAVDSSANYWYVASASNAITSAAALTGRKLYEPYDMTLLFKPM